MRILLIIPAYNEEKNIVNVCKSILEYNKKNKLKLDYIVINDCSKDNTLEKLNNNQINHINLISNLGIGGAVQTGYKYAYQNDYDIAVQFDGDGQHDINFVSEICNPIINGEANMCIGSRYLNKETSQFKSSFMRRLGKNIISIIIKLITGMKVTDPTSGFRAVDRNVIKLFSDEYPVDYPEPESIQTTINKGYKVIEKPVSMNERKSGKSSINPFNSIHYMLKVSITLIIDSMNLKSKKRSDR